LSLIEEDADARDLAVVDVNQMKHIANGRLSLGSVDLPRHGDQDIGANRLDATGLDPSSADRVADLLEALKYFCRSSADLCAGHLARILKRHIAG
jgi:hypothetical protein